MKTTIVTKKRKILRAIYGTLSFSTALFVFQACYGVEGDYGYDVKVYGVITSSADNKPIKGIGVAIVNDYPYAVSNDDGHYEIYVQANENVKLRFHDNDEFSDGAFKQKDTIIVAKSDTLLLNIKLDVK